MNDSIKILRPDGCPTGWTTEYRLRGQVTADTTGSTTVGNTVKALLCSNNNLQVMLLPGTNLSI